MWEIILSSLLAIVGLILTWIALKRDKSKDSVHDLEEYAKLKFTVAMQEKDITELKTELVSVKNNVKLLEQEVRKDLKEMEKGIFIRISSIDEKIDGIKDILINKAK